MEFFRVVPIQINESELKERTLFQQLENVSSQIIPLEGKNENEITVGTIWGEFTLTRYEISGGVRFALKECPNALTWTLTTGFSPSKEHIVIHLTINRTRKNPEFISELKDFLDDMVESLQDKIPSSAAPVLI